MTDFALSVDEGNTYFGLQNGTMRFMSVKSVFEVINRIYILNKNK